ncbi:MAG: hypothetical protein GTO53_04965, partial [Planctomycetales bacterium]|nr:hypothetical protein [Planctomycetales bacterium]NIM08504.1 hypothetical protein [Planctomycetales bacterium]NIN07978.1 hypothetical protein [Planctomycetales bacterium]NIN77107.1 hypothetical protein [Planctomycetales bacterium]NIO34287.1 hypothetical protein [Planctomycetales bacterium]
MHPFQLSHPRPLLHQVQLALFQRGHGGPQLKDHSTLLVQRPWGRGRRVAPFPARSGQAAGERDDPELAAAQRDHLDPDFGWRAIFAPLAEVLSLDVKIHDLSRLG